jgi:hypothetical protein
MLKGTIGCKKCNKDLIRIITDNTDSDAVKQMINLYWDNLDRGWLYNVHG